MGKKLIIAEKPSVARTFSETLNVKESKNGYFENDEYIISWCVGHLVGMSYPEAYGEQYKKWSMEYLPFLPQQYKYEVIKNVKDQYNILKKLLNRTDVDIIYNATDAEREGQAIFSYVLMLSGCNKNAQIKRIWIDSHTDNTIKKGIYNALDASHYDNLTEAAYMRAIVDYAIGINFSRALTLKYGYEFNQAIKATKTRSINVGRVMTCVLGMVVLKEREIRNFKPTPFYKIEAHTNEGDIVSLWKAVKSSHFYESPLLYNETGFSKKETAEKFVSKLGIDPRLMVRNIQKKEEKRKAPYLFNLAELQSECSKKFKISPEETLTIVQTLYEKKLTTYPRTDARVLSTAVCEEIPDILKNLKENAQWREFIEEIYLQNYNTDLKNTRYCDDSKISGHYAIIPTGEIKELQSLKEIERKVYDLITKRFLAIFFPQAIYNNIQIAFIHSSGETFLLSQKDLVEKGFLKVIGIEEKTESKYSNLQNIKENSIYAASFQIKEGSTTAPKRYDSGSMILAMENAGNLIEDEELRSQIKGSGIGTSATRGDILKKLFEIHYLSLNKKTQIITPTTEGELIFDIVEKTIPALLSPAMTASWEKGLSQIENGNISRSEYVKKLNAFIIKSVDTIKKQIVEEAKEEKDEEITSCPFCDGTIILSRYGYRCSNGGKEDDKCKFYLGSSYKDAMSKEQVISLIQNGKSELITNIKNKEGKKFDAFITLDLYEKKVKLEFPKKEEKQSGIICPSCNKELKETDWKYQCECGFSVYHTISKRKISPSEMKKLLQKEKIKVSGFVSKKGKKFDAILKFVDNEIKMEFP